MKVAVDSQIFSIQKYGGISRYFYNIVANSKNLDLKVSAPLYINEYLNNDSCKFLGKSKKVDCPNKFRRPLKYLNELLSLNDFKYFAPDIIHETYYSAIYPYGKKAKRVITIHDLIDFEFANSFPIHNFNKHWKSKAIFEADHIICVSNFTKCKLLEYFHVPEEKISVIHHGVDKFVSPFNFSNINLGTPYLLYVGQRWGYKNFKLFIDAFINSEYLKSNFKIVCFGGEQFAVNELSYFSSKKIMIEQIIGDDIVLNELYKNAAAFVYPSLSEGFGFPILEALNNNCVVIASNKGSIPEILGKHGIYFDPFDIDSIINVLESSLNNSSDLVKNLDLTSKRCELFTVQKSVSETHDCYKKII